jgi:ferredoxin
VEILVTVDSHKCIASETCVNLAPGKFRIGTAGYSSPTQETWTEADLPLLREAESNCPSGAIRVEVEE